MLSVGEVSRLVGLFSGWFQVAIGSHMVATSQFSISIRLSIKAANCASNNRVLIKHAMVGF